MYNCKHDIEWVLVRYSYPTSRDRYSERLRTIRRIVWWYNRLTQGPFEGLVDNI